MTVKATGSSFPSQADMYQMYAYQKKYNAANVTLLYPRTDSMSEKNGIEFISEDGAIVRVCFIDLFGTGRIIHMLGFAQKE